MTARPRSERHQRGFAIDAAGGGVIAELDCVRCQQHHIGVARRAHIVDAEILHLLRVEGRGGVRLRRDYFRSHLCNRCLVRSLPRGGPKGGVMAFCRSPNPTWINGSDGKITHDANRNGGNTRGEKYARPPSSGLFPLDSPLNSPFWSKANRVWRSGGRSELTAMVDGGSGRLSSGRDHPSNHAFSWIDSDR